MNHSEDIFCPAKLNLALHVNGTRADRFHEITSLALRVDFGDRMAIDFLEDTAEQDVLICDVGEVPTDGTNTIFRALSLFRRVFPLQRRLRVTIEKNIPLRSGLGGGSSNAAFFLAALNGMLGSPIDGDGLMKLAALVGRDCPLFLGPSPCIVSGSGEVVEPLEETHLNGLRHTKFLLFRPNFGVDTSWAYEKFDQLGSWALSSRNAALSSIGKLANDLRAGYSSSHYWNALQDVVCEKFLELSQILRDLPEYFKVRGHMTGSGSACYIPMAEDFDSTSIRKYLVDVLGDGALIVETRPIFDR
ncbi:MAG: 4-(cytidine 5'-diphospho)-2-C-methyl-D-erythritol kinase [Puniceicoccales bacterium]|jgi:4-diphosphocytidyl-2-C-methyl-D-erythritol kinase|nr:4-(cytidine 5'-diphospho)-2-C-methyl-D-erythritol kinase [Puniceicoccales bacterium]